MTFNNYYLWYLIDRFNFKIDDVEEMVTFEYNEEGIFTDFVTTYMNKRIKAIKEGNFGLEKFCKMILNAAYGKDGMNTSKYSKIKLFDEQKTSTQVCLPNFKGCRKISSDCYAVQKDSYFYEIKTPIQEALFTLDNSKYWYIKFIYDFMYKCLNMNRVHFIEGDTDSSYWAISGNPDKDYHQRFQYVIENKYYYNHYYLQWFPNPLGGVEDEKKLLGLTIEKEGEGMIALAPKCYCFFTSLKDKITRKAKGVQINRNPDINLDSYKSVLINNNMLFATNVGFRTIPEENNTYSTVKYEQHKIALSAKVLDKMVIFFNHQSCAPLIFNFITDNYVEVI
jgi:hypothetical protein